MHSTDSMRDMARPAIYPRHVRGDGYRVSRRMLVVSNTTPRIASNINQVELGLKFLRSKSGVGTGGVPPVVVNVTPSFAWQHQRNQNNATLVS